MIIDFTKNLSRYRGMSSYMDLAIEYIEASHLSHVPTGRFAVAGDRVYFNHFQYTTTLKTDGGLFEAHQKYLDLHVILSGQELVSVAPVKSLIQVEERVSEDSVMYKGASSFHFPLTAGCFALLYPGEGHLPRLALGGISSDVDKIVFKIQVQNT